MSLLADIRRRVAAEAGVPDRGAVVAAVRGSATAGGGSAGTSAPAVRVGSVLGVRSAREQVADAVADIAGTSAALRRLWEDPEVTDVLVNSPTEVWIDRGRGLEAVRLVGSDGLGDVRALAARLAAAAGQRLDDAAPIADGRLPDGTRLHAVLAPVAAGGACLSLRRHRPLALQLRHWREGGGIGTHGEEVLRALVAVRANVLISGSTGSGKTTLLAAMLAEAPGSERLVCIEETRELQPNHPHVVHLQARAANVQGAGAIDLAQLVRAAMRMRPDRLVLGECRGAEVREVLMALNTGHDGGMATVHANAATDVPARLVALGSLAGLGAETVAAQAVSAFDAVIHVVRLPGRRVVTQIAVLAREGGVLTAALAMQRRVVDGVGDLEPGPAWEALARRLELGRG
ncbi:pilus assembly protein CpaF [Serinibacter arcticus]|uniref:Pilus assembly protein CpaF n=1 Tax=Serinibacter arcticus TaxID=1655435 RepID=A0A2U1ZUN6_9MICO|nr:TadA family conjugal transfer-associated ATPase [Serinibacter arcticus]PWD50707.1 pilus assembly protein CpaF [Serinibacter arcticus]